MKTNVRIILKVLVAVIFVLCIYSTKSNGYYQSKPNATSITMNVRSWFPNIRRLEYPNYGMGLTEKDINTTTLVSNTPNNIDVHMMKNTEYGAMVLLGASDYGKQGIGTAKYMKNGTGDEVTTTGNYTGVYSIGTGWEWTAAARLNYRAEVIFNANERYAARGISERAGEALYTTQGWQNSMVDQVTNSYGASYGRGNNGAFSFGARDMDYNDSYYSRACVVNGNNF